MTSIQRPLHSGTNMVSWKTSWIKIQSSRLFVMDEIFLSLFLFFFPSSVSHLLSLYYPRTHFFSFSDSIFPLPPPIKKRRQQLVILDDEGDRYLLRLKGALFLQIRRRGTRGA